MTPNITEAYVEMMKAEGWKVYTRNNAKYCYVTDGTHIAYAQWSDGRDHVSSVHMPNRQTGTGFMIYDRITPESIREAMNCHAASWATASDVLSVRKYKNWEAFQNSNSFNAMLFEV